MKPTLRMVVFGSLLGLLALAGDSASADTKPKPPPAKSETTENLDPVGRWPKYQAGQTRRIVIWYDDKGWHLRTTTAGQRVTFAGTVTVVGGTVSYLGGIQGLEAKKNPAASDLGVLDPTKTRLEFRFVTGGKEDGFDFRASEKATEIRFLLKVDGYDHPELIYIGKAAQHPKGATFALPAHPSLGKE